MTSINNNNSQRSCECLLMDFAREVTERIHKDHKDLLNKYNRFQGLFALIENIEKQIVSYSQVDGSLNITHDDETKAMFAEANERGFHIPEQDLYSQEEVAQLLKTMKDDFLIMKQKFEDESKMDQMKAQFNQTFLEAIQKMIACIQSIISRIIANMHQRT